MSTHPSHSGSSSESRSVASGSSSDSEDCKCFGTVLEDGLADVVYVKFDGGARGNPGLSGAGSARFNPAGENVESWSLFVSKRATNNDAEWLGAVAAVDLCELNSELEGAHGFCLKGDSEIVINRLNSLHLPLRSLHGAVALSLQRRLLALGVDKVCLRHVLHAENKRADELGNLAMDTLESSCGHDLPPWQWFAAGPQHLHWDSDGSSSNGVPLAAHIWSATSSGSSRSVVVLQPCQRAGRARVFKLVDLDNDVAVRVGRPLVHAVVCLQNWWHGRRFARLTQRLALVIRPPAPVVPATLLVVAL
jgi:ribonuclease HI